MTYALPSFLPTSGGNAVPCYNVAGSMQIWVNTALASSSSESTGAEFLGWTRNGIDLQENANIAELKSDYGGGEQGPPDDYQFLGEIHTITCELARFNDVVLSKLERRMNLAVPRGRGNLIGCLGGRWTALFISQNWARLYTRAFVIDPISKGPLGTAATFPRITFTCLDDPTNTDISPYLTSGWTVSGPNVTFSNTYPVGP